MTGNARAKVAAAMKLAENVGAYEIVEELQELLDMDLRRECKKSMDANGMTMYCTKGSCPDYNECRKAEANVAGHAGRNWFANTGNQPNAPIWAG